MAVKRGARRRFVNANKRIHFVVQDVYVKEQHDRNSKPQTFNTGDNVLVRNFLQDLKG